MFKKFLEISKSIFADFSVYPLLYGSLGLERRLGISLSPDDIDILIPKEFVTGSKWPFLKKHMEDHGYILTDPHEHTFRRDDISASFAVIEELETFAGIDTDSVPLETYGGVSYYLLTLEDYLRVYEASSKDGYRRDHKNKQDNEKIRLIKEKLKNGAFSR